MTFKVTYRAKDGKLCESQLEVASRAECFAQCKARGITPVSVQEDGKGREGPGRPESNVSHEPRTQNRELRKWAVVIALLAIVLGGVWRWLAWEPRTGEVKQPIEKTTHVAKPAHTEKPQTKPVVAVVPMAEGERSEVVSEEKTNGLDKITRVEDKSVESPSHAVQQHVSNNPADQILGMALSTPFGQAIPPIPYYKGLDKDFKLALETPIEDLETDDEQTRALKEVIRRARAEMKEFVDRGMTVQEVLEEYRKTHAENLEVRAGVIREARTLFDSGDIEGAKEYILKMNQALDQMHIPRIEMPYTPEEKRRLRTERGREALARRTQKEVSP